MLKGKMILELTDVHTGKKQTIVEHNMVTNALQNLLRPLGHLNTPSTMYNNGAPYYQKALGGLLLFDNNIEENANNLYAPAGTQLIGCAAYGTQNNTSGTKRGGYNHTESELNLTSRYMKYVYDFTTSQANGTISCICLTHLNGGFTSYGGEDSVLNTSYPLGVTFYDSVMQYAHPSYTGGDTSDKYSGMTIGKSEMLFLIDRAEDVAYYFRINSSTNIEIIKRRAYLQSISVLETPYSKKPVVETIALDELSQEIPTNYFAYNFDRADNCLYIFSSANSYRKVNESFWITKIDISNWRVQQYEMVNTSEVQLNTNGWKYAFAHNGYVYLRTYSSPYDIYKFEIGNAANVTLITKRGMSSAIGAPQLACDGRIYYENCSSDSNAQRVYILDSELNELTMAENYHIYGGSREPCYTPVLNEPLLYFASYGSYTTSGFFVLANYLATINNLSEPVTKTADKTMKVTYIVQEQ